MKKKWNKIRTPNTPPVKDETGKTAHKYILSNGSKNIFLWIREGTSLDLKEIIIGGYADRGFGLVHTYDKEIDSKIIVLEFERKAREARESGAQFKTMYKNYNDQFTLKIFHYNILGNFYD